MLDPGRVPPGPGSKGSDLTSRARTRARTRKMNRKEDGRRGRGLELLRGGLYGLRSGPPPSLARAAAAAAGVGQGGVSAAAWASRPGEDDVGGSFTTAVGPTTYSFLQIQGTLKFRKQVY